MHKKHIIIAVVGAAVLAGGGFGAGYQAGGAAASAAATAARAGRAGTYGASGFAGRSGQGAGASIAVGQVVSADASGISLKLRDGSSIVVIAGTTTPVSENSPKAYSDIAAGDMLIVSGTKNSDNSLTARSIQIAPAGTAETGNFSVTTSGSGSSSTGQSGQGGFGQGGFGGGPGF